MCGEELLTDEQRQAVTEAIEARVIEFLGDVDEWRPAGFAAIPASFAVSYTPACRIRSVSGHLACPLHGPFRPVMPWPSLVRVIGGS